MEIAVTNQQERIDATGLEEMVSRVLELAAKAQNIDDSTEVSIIFADNVTIQELNRQYRHKDSATDVLSFPQADEEDLPVLAGVPRLLGDVVISLEKAYEQAEQYGHSTAREVCYLVVHGFLHLLGYDHQEPTQKEQMRRIEEEIMQKFNLPRD